MPKKRSNGEGALRKEKIQEFLREDAEGSFAEGQGLPDGD